MSQECTRGTAFGLPEGSSFFIGTSSRWKNGVPQLALTASVLPSGDQAA